MVSLKANHDCKKELKQMELKATPARLAVLNLLEKSQEPVDIVTVIEKLQKLKIKTDPATVFRIMNIFKEKGIAKQIQLHEGKFRYELSSKQEHHHVVCRKCGKVCDVSDCIGEDIVKKVAKKTGYTIQMHCLEFFGLCKSCQL